MIKRQGQFHATDDDTIVVNKQIDGPPQAWVIVGAVWYHNDEWNSQEDGNSLEPNVFYNQAVAEAKCKLLNDQFYAENPTPTGFELNPGNYEDDLPEDIDEDEVTWEQLKEFANWQDPYQVVELTKCDRVEEESVAGS